MAGYSLSSKAAADLEGIHLRNTILTFGLEQASAYLTGLHKHLDILSGHPMQGRSAGELAPGLSRSEYQSHIVFLFVSRQ